MNYNSSNIAFAPNNKSTMKKQDRQKTVFLITLFALPVINFLVFWLYLNFSALDFAFKVEMADGSTKYSLQNFKSLFQAIAMPNSTFWVALKNTLLYWFTSSVLSYIVALFIGYFLFKRTPGYSVFKFVFYLPCLIAPTILVALFKQIIARNGPINLFYGGDFAAVPLFLASEELAIWTCLFYSFFFGLGTNLLVISGAMSQVDGNIIDAGRIDGVNWMQEMVKIVIPIIWPTIIATLIGNIAGIFNASGPILLLTNGQYKTYTINFWIFQQVYTGQNYYYPAAIGLFFALIAIPLTLFSRRLLRKVVPSNDSMGD